MNSTHLLSGISRVLTFVCSILFAHYVCGQFVPGPYYYSDAGVMGAATSAYQSAAQQQVYQQNRQMQMQSSTARSAAWLGINRSMQSEAASRPTSVADSGQERAIGCSSVPHPAGLVVILEGL